MPRADLPTPAPERIDRRRAANERNDYANPAFSKTLSDGLKAFYRRQFQPARDAFEAALKIIPDNTLALSFLNASAANIPGALDTLINTEEDAVGATSKNYFKHVRLGFSYMFASATGRDRRQDARDEFNHAVNLNAKAPAAHVALGIMRFDDRSMNLAKTEFLAALRADPNNVLAREYLGIIYQVDLKDPQRGLAYVIDIPNLVPGYADIDFHIGSILDDLKQYNEALKYLTTGLQLDTASVGESGQHGYVLIGRIYLEQHKITDATRAFKSAIANKTDVTIAKTWLNKIQRGDFDAPKKT